MRKILLLVVCLLLTASLTYAQPGSIGVFGDPAGMTCDIYDYVPAVVDVYVVHVFTPGASACQFMVDDSGVYMMYLAESVNPFYIGIGYSRSGISIAYNGCVPSPNMVLTMTYFFQALTPPCSYIKVVPHPTASPPGLYVWDCAFPAPNMLTATGGTAIVNPTASCMCDVPTEETTWGKIKNLYK